MKDLSKRIQHNYVCSRTFPVLHHFTIAKVPYSCQHQVRTNVSDPVKGLVLDHLQIEIFADMKIFANIHQYIRDQS